MGLNSKRMQSIDYNYQKQTLRQDLNHDVSMRLVTVKSAITLLVDTRSDEDYARKDSVFKRMRHLELMRIINVPAKIA